MEDQQGDLHQLERFALSLDRDSALPECFPSGTPARSYYEVLRSILGKDLNTATALLSRHQPQLPSEQYRQLEGILHMHTWDDAAPPEQLAGLQQYLLKALKLDFSAIPAYVPNAPVDADDFEQVGPTLYPSAISESEYSLSQLMKQLDPCHLADMRSLAVLRQLFAAGNHQMQVLILKGKDKSCPVASLPGVERVISKWLSENLEEAGNWLKGHAKELTAEQIRSLLPSSPAALGVQLAQGGGGALHNPRLVRLLMCALVHKLDPPADSHDVEALDTYLISVEQLCQQLGPPADWIRVQVLSSQLDLQYTHPATPITPAQLQQFLQMTQRIAWMAPPILTWEAGQTVHVGVGCDQCMTRPIRGVRYKSQKHHDYDLCERCHAAPGLHAQAQGPYSVISGDTYNNFIFLDFLEDLAPIHMPRGNMGLQAQVEKWLRQVALTAGRELASAWPHPLSQLLPQDLFNRTVAEAMLLSGPAVAGPDEQYWTRMYESAGGRASQLMQRQQLELTPQNKTMYGVDEAVTLQVCVKNIPSVLIKVYEINTWTYYTNERRELDPSLQLVGVSASMEKTLTFSKPPMQREVATWQLLEGVRGTFVVDIIGGQHASRAIVKKGRLRYLQQLTTAGHLLRVFYEDWSPVPGARAWLCGRTYHAGPDGEIVIPYARSQAAETLVLGDANGLASIYEADGPGFTHQEERYTLRLGAYLDCECVKPHMDLPLLLTTSLCGNGMQPAELDLMEGVVLALEMGWVGGTVSTKVIKDFKLRAEPQVVPIRLPESCHTLTVKLSGKIKLVAPEANGEPRYANLEERQSFPLQPEASIAAYDAHLTGLPNGGWALQVLGRAGEVPNDPIRMRVGLIPALGMAQPSERPRLTFEVQTNAQGQVKLGALPGIEIVTVEPPGGNTNPAVTDENHLRLVRVWHMRGARRDRGCWADAMEVQVPAPSGGCAADITLVHAAGSTYGSSDGGEGGGHEVFLWRTTRHHGGDHGSQASEVVADIAAQHVRVQAGSLLLSGLPPGHYLLADAGSSTRCKIHVVESSVPPDHPAWQYNQIPALHMALQHSVPRTLSISSLQASATDGVTVQVREGEGAQVVLLFRRFMPLLQEEARLQLGYSMERMQQEQRSAQLDTQFCPPTSSYLSSLEPLSPALQYVLQRRQRWLPRRPGNMLDRPSLLSLPHMVGTTATVNQKLPTQVAAPSFAAAPAPPPGALEPHSRGALFGMAADSHGAPPTKGIPNVWRNEFEEAYEASPFSASFGGTHSDERSGRLLTGIHECGRAEPAERVDSGMPLLAFCPSSVLLGPLSLRGAGGSATLQLSPQQLREQGVDLSASGHTILLAVVLDGEGACSCSSLTTITGAIPASSAPLLDLGLTKAAESGQQYVPTWGADILQPGRQLLISDLHSSKLAVYDNVSKAMTVLEAVLKSKRLNEPARRLGTDFNFLPEWAELSTEQKLKHLKERASHELSFFVYHRDRPFFDAVLLPSINTKLKSERTFLDWWFLRDPDTLSHWSAPSRYMRLHAVERILLAQLGGEEQLRLLALGWKQSLEPGKDSIQVARHLSERQRLIQMAIEALGPAEQSPGSEGGMELSGAPMAAAPAAIGGRGFGLQPQGAAHVMMEPQMERMAQAGAQREGMAGRRLVQMEEAKALFKEEVVTQVWAETSYYKVKPALEHERLGTSWLVQTSLYWLDYAEWLANGSQGHFLSPHLPYAATSFTSAVMALAVTGLRPAGGSQERGATTKQEGAGLSIRAEAPCIVYHHQQVPATTRSHSQAVLVSQTLIDIREPESKDATTGEVMVKAVESPLKTGRLYSYSVVAINTSPTEQQLELVVQVPQGAIQLASPSTSTSLTLPPFSGQRHSILFYFPHPGTFAQYPCAVLRQGQLVWTPQDPLPPLAVLPTLPPAPPPTHPSEPEFDWDKFASTASNQEMLEFLATGDLSKANLGRIAPRCLDKGFYEAATHRLRLRHRYEQEVWKFSVRHMDGAGLREYLPLTALWWILGNAGGAVTPLGKVPPSGVGRGYRHLEYWPVVHRLAHPMPGQAGSPGGSALNQLLKDNASICKQWHSFLLVLACKLELEPQDVLEAAQYLILQDRLDDAQQLLERFYTASSAAAQQLGSECGMQVDYLRAWLNVSSLSGDLSVAEEVDAKYRDCRNPFWTPRFQELHCMLEEVAAAAAGRSFVRQADSKLAEVAEPLLMVKEARLAGADGCLLLKTRGLKEVQVSMYPIDLELLFTDQPFGQLARAAVSGGAAAAGAAGGQGLGKVSYVKPTFSHMVPVVFPEGSPGTEQQRTAEQEMCLQIGAMLAAAGLANRSVVVELSASGLTRSMLRFASNLQVELQELQGLLQVLDATTSLPLPATYIKVYARARPDSKPWLFKDGYTDRRGKFDYAAITAGAGDERPAQFALLVVSDSNGAVVLEANAPA